MTFTQYVQSHLALVIFLSNAILIWVCVFYNPAVERNPSHPAIPLFQDRRWAAIWVTNCLLAGGLTWLVSGKIVKLGIFTLLYGIFFACLRERTRSRWLAEIELVGNVLYIASLAALAHATHLFTGPPPQGRFNPGHLVTVKLIASVVIYVEAGGTNIVRGLLEKGRILPVAQAVHPSSSEALDTVEYNHGRLIGNAERLLLLALVAIQAYQALAFLMTAKGLFRAKALDDRNFSEYFLVGTLVSSSVAVAAGLLIQLIVKLCWS
jgi:hypothetical protein